jgi:glycosyltransferase involved in cell wall biosynthesis
MDDLDSRKWHDLAANARWPMRSIYRLEARRMACREQQWLNRFDATLMVSQREADLVTDPHLRAKVHVIPPVLPGLSDCGDASPVSGTLPIVGFLGAMDYPPNVDAACWLARDIWPLVREQHPEARLSIVGRSPVPAVRDLGRDDSIVVTGTVPDVQRYLSAMRVHVAPLRVSRGVQIKVLTAMAAGRPCVVTSCVAEGLGAHNGRDLIVADTAPDLAAAVTHLLDNPEKAQALGQAGQRFVRQFDLNEVTGRIERLLAGGEAAQEPPLPDAGRLETKVERQPQREPALVGEG